MLAENFFGDTAKSVLKDSIHSAFWQYDVPVAQRNILINYRCPV